MLVSSPTEPARGGDIGRSQGLCKHHRTDCFSLPGTFCTQSCLPTAPGGSQCHSQPSPITFCFIFLSLLALPRAGHHKAAFPTLTRERAGHSSLPRTARHDGGNFIDASIHGAHLSPAPDRAVGGTPGACSSLVTRAQLQRAGCCLSSCRAGHPCISCLWSTWPSYTAACVTAVWLSQA